MHFYFIGTITDLKELLKRFRMQIYGFALVEVQFESLMVFKPSLSKRIPLDALFDILDNDHDGRVDGLELLGGLALICQGSFEDKARFCFELFDFNLNSTLSKKEMIVMLMSSINGMNMLSGGNEEDELDLESFEKIADEAFGKADRDRSGSVSYEEFVAWARSNRVIMAGLDSLNRVAFDAIEDLTSEDSAPEADDEYLSGIDEEEEKETYYEALLNNQSPVVREGNTSSRVRNTERNHVKTRGIFPWKLQIIEPTNNVKRDVSSVSSSHEGPGSNLDLFWAFGSSAQCTRNNVRYVSTSADHSSSTPFSIIYPLAAVVVVYSSTTHKQNFYQGHNSEVTALNVHPNHFIVISGDMESSIHMWSAHSLACLTVIDGMGNNGIQSIVFSPLSGDKFATVSRDNDHTIALYDSNNGALLSSGKGLSAPNMVLDCAFNHQTSEFAIVGRKVVKFYKNINMSKRTLECVTGKVGSKGRRQAFLCITYIGVDEAVVGCASGEIYRFQQFKCVQIIQAHGINDAIFCCYFNTDEYTLVTGAADNQIKTWDTSLKSIGDFLDLSESSNGNNHACLNQTVTSIQSMNGRLLIGTRGADVYEATIPASNHGSKSNGSHSNNSEGVASYMVQRIASGHCRGSMGSIAIHPLRDEFATTGDDKTIRIWSLRSMQQINMRVLPDNCYATAYDNNRGDLLCLGLCDGSVALMESRRLHVYSTWRHSKEPITVIKFSSDCNYLVVGSADNNIYIYQTFDKRNYARLAICRGHNDDVTHLDISLNNKYIRSNSKEEGVLLYWDMTGNLITNPVLVRDMVWHTNTCIYDYCVKGVWNSSSRNSDVLACEASHETTDLVTGNNLGEINLYRYPATGASNTLYQTYLGHAGPICAVRYLHSRRYIISTGAQDRSILVWKHELEVLDESDDEPDPILGMTKGKQKLNALTQEEEFEAVSKLLPQDFGNVSDATCRSSGCDESLVVQPWKSAIVEPTLSGISDGNSSTDVDLVLQWVHGYRGFDCKDNVKYNASGHIVYFAASVAIVYNKSTGKQSMLQGIHTDEIISIAAHPAGQYFATGGRAKNPKMVVFTSQPDVAAVQVIADAHQNGVSALCFNNKGDILASLGMDANSTLAFHAWDKNVMLLKTHTGKGKIYCLSFMDRDSSETKARVSAVESNPQPTSGAAVSSASFDVSNSYIDVAITGGEKHLKFWWISNGKNIKTQRGLWNNEDCNTNILCVASETPNVCVTGDSNGRVLLWEDFKCVYNAARGYETLGRVTASTTAGVEATVSSAAVPLGENEHAYPHGNSPIQAMCAVKGVVPVLFDINNDLTQHAVSEAPKYITADSNGIIAFWILLRNAAKMDALELKCVRTVDIKVAVTPPILSSSQTPRSFVSIKSIAIKEGGGALVIGTQGCEIYEILIEPFENVITSNLSKDADNKANEMTIYDADQVVSGHFIGEVWALCSHPTLNVFFTAADDCTVRCWNLQTHKLISYVKLPEKCRAIDILPTTGGELAIPLNSGVVWIVNTSDAFLNPKQLSSSFIKSSSGGEHTAIDPSLCGALVEVNDGSESNNGFNSKENENRSNSYSSSTAKVKCLSNPILLTSGPTKWVQMLKYAFNGSLLAVGSHDHSIYIYSVSGGSGSGPMELAATGNTKHVMNNYELKHELKGHNSYIMHLDFGVCVQTDNVVSQKYDPSTNRVLVMKSKVTDKNSGKDVPRQMTVKNNFLGKSKSMNQFDYEEVEVELTEQDIVLQSSCGNYELLFWRCDEGKQIKSPSVVKDTWWATYTSTFGWPVQGIYSPQSDGGDINAVARSHSYDRVPCMAIVDDFKSVRLFNYPCLNSGAPDKCYKGHSGFVANVCFSHDDTYLITAGGDDKSIFVWATDVKEELQRRSALMPHGIRSPNHGIGAHTGTTHDHDSSSFKAPTKKAHNMTYNQVSPLANDMISDMPSGGDEFAAIKPWKSSIRAPSNWTEPTGEKLGSEPSSTLELKFAYGYRGWDCRNNLGFGDSIYNTIYHIAGVGVMYNSHTHTQVHNTEHDDDILCLAIHPHGHIVATGEIGKKPKIVLWDASTGTTIRIIKYHTKGVSHLTFSSGGDLLVSIGMDTDRMLAVHNIHSGNCVGTGKVGKGIDIYGLAAGSNDTFVTNGKGHIKFWELPSGSTAKSGELPSKSGIYNKDVKERSVVSSCYLSATADVVTGMSTGTLLLWKDRTNSKYVKNAHKGAISALCIIGDSSNNASSANVKSKSNESSLIVAGGGNHSSNNQFISGGKDGFIHIWDGNQLKKIWTCDMNASTPASVLPQIAALACRDNKIVVGTKGAEIFEIDRVTNDMLLLVQGHFGSKAECWGLSPIFDGNRNNNKFITVCDDQTVRLWDGNSKRMLSMVQIECKARAVTSTSSGSLVAIGGMDGRVIVLATNDLTSEVANITVAKSWIQCMSYTMNSKLLAVGSHDNNIYILDTKTYSTRNVCKGHHSYITGIDFSIDGTKLQSTSGDYELLFWNAESGKQIKSASSVQDELWATWSLPFGWPVQGIFPPNSDGTDINSVTRSNIYDDSVISNAISGNSSGSSNGSGSKSKSGGSKSGSAGAAVLQNTLIATGDDSKKVKIFKYPVVKEHAKFKEYKGHSEHVTNVKFSNGEKFVYSTGGLDKAILQFEIKQTRK